MNIQNAQMYSDTLRWPILKIDDRLYLFGPRTLVRSELEFNSWICDISKSVTIDEALLRIKELNNGNFPELPQ